MKLMMIEVRDEDKEKVLRALIEKGYSPTYIASTGEFLQFGKSLFLLGVKESEITRVHETVKEHTKNTVIRGGEELRANVYVLNARVEKVNTVK